MLKNENKTFKPFAYPWAYEFWLKHEGAHWLHTSDIKMQQDVIDHQRVPKEVRAYVDTQLLYFTQGDKDINDAYVETYLPAFPQTEIRMALCSIAARECVHIAAYSNLTETLGHPETIYTEFMKHREMREKHEYFSQAIGKAETPAELALKMATITAFGEGVALFGTFLYLLNLGYNGWYPGMTNINTFSIIEEDMHCVFITRLFRTLVKENPEIWTDDLKSKIYDAGRKMIALEDDTIELIHSKLGEVKLPKNHVDKELAKQYVRFIMDRRLIALGLKAEYGIEKNPCPWMEEMVRLPSHSNFFESDETSYSKGLLTGSWDDVFPTKLL